MGQNLTDVGDADADMMLVDTDAEVTLLAWDRHEPCAPPHDCIITQSQVRRCFRGMQLDFRSGEGHVLQPLVMGRAVSIHPLAIVLAIAGGAVLAGIVGALLAVPVLAFLNSAVRVLIADDPVAEEEAQEADDAPVIEAEPDDVEQIE